MRYPADPPTVEEIVAVMRRAGDGVHGRRPRGLIVVLWRAGLRICEALALAEADLDPRRGSLLVRRAGRPAPRGGHGRLGVGSSSNHGSRPGSSCQCGPLFCVVNGPTRGRPWTATGDPQLQVVASSEEVVRNRTLARRGYDASGRDESAIASMLCSASAERPCECRAWSWLTVRA